MLVTLLYIRKDYIEVDSRKTVFTIPITGDRWGGTPRNLERSAIYAK